MRLLSAQCSLGKALSPQKTNSNVVYMYVCVCTMCLYVTKVFMGKIEIIVYGMSVDNHMVAKRGHGQTNQSHDINWDAYLMHLS